MRRILLLLAAAGAAFAQASVNTPPPFTMRILQGTTVQNVTSGATLALPADGIGLPSTASITLILNDPTHNTTQAVINSVQLTGSTDFSVPNAPGTAPTLTATNSTAGYGVQYLPTSSKAQAATLEFNFTATTNTNATFTGSVFLNLTGTAPEYGYTFAQQPNGNSTLLNPGDTITMPQTPVSTSATALISITNRGSGQGVVNGITYKGSPDIALAGLPFPPATIAPGASLQFQVVFTPSDLPAVNGSVQVDFVAGRNFTFGVMGTGSGAEFSYAVIRANRPVAVSPGNLIAVPDANVNDTSSLTMKVSNVGNDFGTIKAISISGTGYSLTQLPFLPDTMGPGDTISLTINFTPAQAGKALGKLKVGNDSFDLSANGLGPVLTYSYVSSSSTFALQSGGSVVFAPVTVGQSNTIHFVVGNTGTAGASINSISATGPAATTFVLANAPKLPATVAANSQVGFDLTFAPSAIGAVSGTLRIDSQTFTLTGVGSAPAALPGYSFSGTSGTVDPRSQPAVSLSLAAPYPMDVTGTLNLAFNSSVFANDPAVQFQVGGRTVTFTIPANSTKAVFANQATQIQLQAGTVAGTIVLTPTFATALGGLDVTPVNPPALTLTVPQQAPALLNVVVSGTTGNTITLAVTGFATGRSITQMDFVFTPVATENLGTTHITLPADASFSAWYQGSASAAFGSNFTATVTFTLSGDLKKASSLANAIQSIAVTLTNGQGTSASKSVTVAQ